MWLSQKIIQSDPDSSPIIVAVGHLWFVSASWFSHKKSLHREMSQLAISYHLWCRYRGLTFCRCSLQLRSSLEWHLHGDNDAIFRQSHVGIRVLKGFLQGVDNMAHLVEELWNQLIKIHVFNCAFHLIPNSRTNPVFLPMEQWPKPLLVNFNRGVILPFLYWWVTWSMNWKSRSKSISIYTRVSNTALNQSPSKGNPNSKDWLKAN